MRRGRTSKLKQSDFEVGDRAVLVVTQEMIDDCGWDPLVGTIDAPGTFEVTVVGLESKADGGGVEVEFDVEWGPRKWKGSKAGAVFRPDELMLPRLARTER